MSNVGLPLNMDARTIDQTISIPALGTIAIDAESYVTQTPTGLDIAMALTFGPAQTTPYVDLSVGGMFTFLVEGFYEVRIRVNAGRTTQPGSSVLVARSIINGTQAGPSVIQKLDNSNDSETMELTFAATFFVGDTLYFQAIRDSAGVDNGFLFTFNPTDPTWNDVPSTDILMRYWERVT